MTFQKLSQNHFHSNITQAPDTIPAPGSNGAPGEDPSPVFICGYPKSGTTLLLALLDSHPELLVFPEETRFLGSILGHPSNQNFRYVLDHTGASDLRYGKVEMSSGYRDYSNIDFAEYQQRLRQRWEDSGKTEPSLLESIVLSYGDVTGQTDRKFWVEKTPANEIHLHKAADIWPNLRAIYIVRDPRDNFCSYRLHNERRSRRFVPDWRNSVRAWERFANRSPNALLVRYEDLVHSPPTMMQQICDFLGICWHETLLEPTRNGVFWSGNSKHGSEFKGISTTSLGKYREILTPEEVAHLENHLGRIMKRYGWEPEYTSSSTHLAAYELIEEIKRMLYARRRTLRHLMKMAGL